MDNSEVTTVTDATEEPESSDISHSMLFSKHGSLPMTAETNEAVGPVPTNGVGESRNSTTLPADTGFETTHGESTDPRSVRIRERADRLTGLALAKLFVHLDGIAPRQLSAIDRFYVMHLNDCESNVQEECMERWFTSMINRHAPQIERFLERGFWKSMQLPTTYYWSAKPRAGIRDARKLMQGLSLSKLHRVTRNIDMQHEFKQWEKENSGWVEYSMQPKFGEPVSTGFKKEKPLNKKRISNEEKLADVLQQLVPGYLRKTAPLTP